MKHNKIYHIVKSVGTAFSQQPVERLITTYTNKKDAIKELTKLRKLNTNLSCVYWWDFTFKSNKKGC